MDNLKFSRVRFFILLILVLIGIGICIDLTYIFIKTNFFEHFAPSFCSVSDFVDCDGVALTQYSVSFGVPNSLWGILLYCVMLMLLFVDRIQAKFKNTIFDVFENPQSYITSLALLSFAISMILASISIFKINKICVLCFCTYFVDLFIAIASRSKDGFFYDIKTTVLDFIKGAKNHFILFIIVLVAFISTIVYLDKSMIASPKIKKERAQKEFYADTNKYAIKGNTLGKENSKVVVTLYSDFNCPFCKVVNIMVHKLAREEDVLVEEVSYPLDKTCNPHIGATLGGHENSCMYSKYALAAKKQGKYWGVASVLFDKHPKTLDEMMAEFKEAHLGLDEAQLRSDANSPEIENELKEEIDRTAQRGIMGTPVLEINGITYMGVLPYDELVEKVRIAKKRAQNEN